jgi:hypothetical protein
MSAYYFVQLERTWLLPNLYNGLHTHCKKKMYIPLLQFAYLHHPSGLFHQYSPYSSTEGTLHILPPIPSNPFIISDP